LPCTRDLSCYFGFMLLPIRRRHHRLNAQD
jgi:hypothetical protein